MSSIDFKNIRVSVAGIGISNRPLIEYLLEQGAVITARDLKPKDKLEPVAGEFEAKGVRLVCGENYLDDIDDEYIFRSPGIRYDKPGLLKAAANGSILTSEMEIFFELCPATLIGITGSDGKSTTTTLIAKFIEAQFGHVYVGGNLGTPLLPKVSAMTAEDFAVVELSSFQLHTMKKSPDTAVITNISPNHLDYHTDMDEYIAAKENIFKHQISGNTLILNYNNEITRNMAEKANPGVDVIFFNHESGLYMKNDKIYYQDKFIIDRGEILLPGRHNADNFMTAIAAVSDFVDNDKYINIARTFKGVEHRLEFVRELNGVRYYNGSIDSSPTRTAAALSAFDKKVIIICGGYDKNIPYEPLVKPLCDKSKVVVLTGATGPKIRQALIDSGEDLPLIIEESDFENAVTKAREAADIGDIVLLSPASASFDAFPNFEVRGNKFKEIINNFT